MSVALRYAAGKVALLSAKKYAPSVVPIMLYPGNYNAYMKWFEQEGGLAFHHRTSLLPRWQVRAGLAAGPEAGCQHDVDV